MEDTKNIRSGFFKMKKLFFLHLLFLIILPAFVVMLTDPELVKAQKTTIPFGGMVNTAIYCSCNSGMTSYYLYISPPVGGPLLYVQGQSFQYPNRSLPRPGVWALGLYDTGGVCMVGVKPYCTSLPVMGTIDYVGTSM
ncbi:MAG: hypothetical protein ACLFNN_01655 [Candidatus Paceibacterota bacterium]